MTPWLGLAFFGLVGTLAVIDLAVLTRRPRVVRSADALASMALWLLSAAAFALALRYVYLHNFLDLRSEVSFPIDRAPITGDAAMAQFVASYLLELVLSLDNISVIALMTAYLGVRTELVPRLLFWSILSALAVRAVAIYGCAEVLRSHEWFRYVLGGVLVCAALRVLALPNEHTDLSRRWTVRLMCRLIAVGPGGATQSLLTRAGGTLRATPLFLAVAVIGLLDAAYAADSIPAVFAVTKDPFIAFTGSAFAVMALRSLYFLLSGVLPKFRFLRLALVLVLATIAARTFIDRTHVGPPWATLGIVLAIMLGAVGASAIYNRMKSLPQPSAKAAGTPRPLDDLSDAVAATRRNLRKVLILIAGTFIIVFGIAIAPLPGPGPTILVPIGLALLATEFVWARRLLDSVKAGAFNIGDRLDAAVDRIGAWSIPVFAVVYWTGAIWLLSGLFGLKWYLIAVVAGSPFIPFAIWAVNSLRKRRGGATRKHPEAGRVSATDPMQTPATEQNSYPPPGADAADDDGAPTPPDAESR